MPRRFTDQPAGGPSFPPGITPIGGIPIVEHWLFRSPTLLHPPLVTETTLFIKPGTYDEVAFQLRTQAVAWTFKRAMEEDGPEDDKQEGERCQ